MKKRARRDSHAKDGVYGDKLVEGRRRLHYTESEQAIAKVARAPSHEWE
jgi:hypothetical protein